MTREEFIQQAALRLITARPDKLMYEIAELAENLANCVYGEEKVKGPVVVSCVTADEPIGNLIREIDRMDEEKKKAGTEKMRKAGFTRMYNQKSGYAEMVRKACVVKDFKHVLDLVNFGRENFRRLRSIGEKCTEAVDKALYNLYHIKNW